MKGISFGNIHSYYDLNLILAPFTPTPATPKTNFLNVPGRDGHLDLTEANGEVKFNSREFLFTFTVAPGDDMTFDQRLAKVSDALNGQRFRITLDRDPDFYWSGRCEVNKYSQNKAIKEITVKATVEPYKLKKSETKAIFALSSAEKIVMLENGRMAAVPVIECTNDNTVVEFNSHVYTLAAGTHRILDIRFVQGINILNLSGTGTIIFTWQEGEL